MISKKSSSGLDLLNLCLADVRDGIGPFLGIYLLSVHHWNLRDIGIVSSIMTVAGVVAQTPAGAYIDKVRNKHRVIGIAALLVGLGTLVIIIEPGFTVVSISQIVVGIAAAFIAPGIAAMTLGLTGYKSFDARVSSGSVSFRERSDAATRRTIHCIKEQCKCVGVYVGLYYCGTTGHGSCCHVLRSIFRERSQTLDADLLFRPSSQGFPLYIKR